MPSPVQSPHRSSALWCVAGFAVLAAGAYILPIVDLVHALLRDGLDYRATDRDFANYWMGGRLVLVGDQQMLFTHDVYFGRFKEVFGGDSEIRSWSYPPHFLLFVWPLGLLPYQVAMAVFLLISGVLFMAAVTLFRRVYAPQSDAALLWLALAAYMLMMVAATQNGFLTSAALLFGLGLMERRPVLAGLAFACLTVKPQLGFLIPLLLIFSRNWRTVGWSAFFTAILIGLSAALFGVDSWRAYLADTLAYQRSVMTDWYGIFLSMMPTVFGGVRSLGLPPGLALQMQLPVSIFAAALVVWILRNETDPLRRIFAVTGGTFLITPYAFNYDMGALSAVAAMLAGSNYAPARRPAVMVIAVIAAIPAAVTNLGRANLPITPLILAAALIVLAAEARRSRQRVCAREMLDLAG